MSGPTFELTANNKDERKPLLVNGAQGGKMARDQGPAPKTSI